MKLLINTGIFSTPLKPNDSRIGRGRLQHRDSDVDIFLYMLHSFQNISKLFSECHLNFCLEEQYKNRKQDITDIVNKIFSNKKVFLNYSRFDQQPQWQQWIRDYNDNNEDIFFLGNHDHILLGDKYFEEFYNVYNQHTNRYKGLCFSSWAEALGGTCNVDWSDYSVKPVIDITEKAKYIPGSKMADSIQIISGEVFHYWWNHRQYEQVIWRRTDEFGYCVDQIEMDIFIPPVELFRHYDGYKIPNICPALTIPPGFFTDSIKIRYGYNENYPDCVNINPSKPNYTDTDSNGTDYKWILEDIPYFWKDKIIDIDINPAFNQEQGKQDRAMSIYKIVMSKVYGIPYRQPQEVRDFMQKMLNYVQRGYGL